MVKKGSFFIDFYQNWQEPLSISVNKLYYLSEVSP